MPSPAERGYSPAPDLYDHALIERKLNGIGFHVLPFEPVTKSTMLLTARYAHSDGVLPTVAYTDHQTAGIARDETKIWHDNPGSSILFSVLLPVSEDPVAELSDLAALRVCLALQKTGADFKIKAPNDIVDATSGKKVSGVLVQNIYDGENHYAGTNIGVGVNVHYTDEQLTSYPTDYGATSVDTAAGKFNIRQELFIDILEGIATVVPEAIAMVKGESRSVRDVQNALWRENSYLLGETIVVSEGEKNQIGTVINTEIGQGIVLLESDDTRTQIDIFNSDTKVRLAI